MVKTISKGVAPPTLDIESKQNENIFQSSEYSLQIVDNCLTKYGASESMRIDFIQDVCKILHINSDKLERSIINHDTSNPSTFTSSGSKKRKSDEHNEACDVCAVGGDLLCCDTCSLVFHTTCLYPKLLVIPKGHWSCPYCIVDGVSQGDAKEAEKSIKLMKVSNKEKIAGSADGIDFTRSGRAILVRKLVKGQYIDLGRHDELEDALLSFRSVAPAFFRYERSNVDDVVSLDTASVSDEDGLWCSYCFDDPQIKLCAFCGCRKCFGKHYSEFLLLCDSCDQETHTFCLDPPLYEVPKGSWFCEPCTKVAADNQHRMEVMASIEASSAHDKNINETMRAESIVDAMSTTIPQLEVDTGTYEDDMMDMNESDSRNKRGRPKGSLGRSRAKNRGRPIGSISNKPVPSELPGCIAMSVRRSNKRSISLDSPMHPLPSPSGLTNMTSFISPPPSSSSSYQKQPTEEGEVMIGVLGVESALRIVSIMKKRILTAKEKELLHVFRDTAPTSDLMLALNELLRERDKMKDIVASGYATAPFSS